MIITGTNNAQQHPRKAVATPKMTLSVFELWCRYCG
jgi:hypothetical protein